MTLCEIKSLTELNTKADEALNELFKSVAEQEEQERARARQKTISRIEKLHAQIAEFAPVVIMRYLELEPGSNDEDFLTKTEMDLEVVIRLPEAFPIYFHTWWHVFDKQWKFPVVFTIRNENGWFVGQHENFLLSLGAARSHYRSQLDKVPLQVVD